MKVILAALVVAALAVPTLASAASAAPRGLTEWQAENALHYGYALEDDDQISELATLLGQAKASEAGLKAQKADPTSISVAHAEVEGARRALENEQLGHQLFLEDCLGLGQSTRISWDETFTQFRCRISADTNSGYVTRTLVFSAGELNSMATAPRPTGGPAWNERTMEDRLVSYGRLIDPREVRMAREDLEETQTMIVEMRASGLNPEHYVAHEREAKRALAFFSAGHKIASASCVGMHAPRSQGSRPRYEAFRCRVRANGDRAFMVVKTKSPSRFVVKNTQFLAPLT